MPCPWPFGGGRRTALEIAFWIESWKSPEAFVETMMGAFTWPVSSTFRITRVW